VLNNEFSIISHGVHDFSIGLYIFSNNPSCSNPINLFTTPNLVDLNRLWHQCLNHIHQKNMILMSKHKIVIGLSKIEPSWWICEACILGKQTKERAPCQSFHRSKISLEIIHSDVYGPLFRLSFIGAWYILTFIDDYSHYGCVYFLKNKSDVFDMFQTF